MNFMAPKMIDYRYKMHIGGFPANVYAGHPLHIKRLSHKNCSITDTSSKCVQRNILICLQWSKGKLTQHNAYTECSLTQTEQLPSILITFSLRVNLMLGQLCPFKMSQIFPHQFVTIKCHMGAVCGACTSVMQKRWATILTSVGPTVRVHRPRHLNHL